MPEKAKCSTYARQIMIMDIYKRPFYFLMPDRSEYERNYFGTFLGILTILIISSYGTFKFRDLINSNDFKLSEV